MRRGICLALVAAWGCGAAVWGRADAWRLLVVEGAPGVAEYGELFAAQAQRWEELAHRGDHAVTVIGRGETGGLSDRDALQAALRESAQEKAGWLWVVLIGHGTFDGHEARFNLRGPDVSAAELQEWLGCVERPVVVVNTGSSSSPFLKALSGTNRVVMTATRSGFEHNATRFGTYLVECFDDEEADLDQDGQVSLLEAFVVASSRVAEFYRTEGRLMTEHALLDDNADGLGTPADWYRGVRVVRRSEKGELPDGARAHQLHLLPSAAERALSPEVREERDALVLEVVRLRERRAEMEEEAYFGSLEEVLMRLARLYREAEAGSGPSPAVEDATPAIDESGADGKPVANEHE